jgi:hypothetical protein
MPGGQLLGECGLNSVEEPLEPTDQLRLRNPQFGLGGNAVAERQAQAAQFGAKLWRQTLLELGDR